MVSGLAFQTLQFAFYGASITFVDIVGDNLDVIRRVAKSKGVEDRVCATVPVIGQVHTHTPPTLTPRRSKPFTSGRAARSEGQSV